MKKLLVLGGATAQVPLIRAAKEAGLYVVLCDWTTTNPGIPIADKHYQVSTLDLKAVLEVAKLEKVDGVISNSEPAMHNVAVVAEQLGLVGNSPLAVDILDSKYRFRELQRKCGVFFPKSSEVENEKQLSESLRNLQFPIIVKPSENSGSRGITVAFQNNLKEIMPIFEECRNFSRNGKVTVEEYIKMPSLYNVGGDIFVHHGKIIWDGLATCIRTEVAPMVPTGKMWPICESEQHIQTIKSALEKLIQKSGIIHGAYNIEGYFTDADDFFVIEINTRQGGNDIPQLIEEYCGIDMYKLLVTTAVGNDEYFEQVVANEFTKSKKYITNYIVFSSKDTIYKGIEIDGSIRSMVYKVIECKQLGEKIRHKKDATDAVAMIRMSFDTQAQQLMFLQNADHLIKLNGGGGATKQFNVVRCIPPFVQRAA